MSEAKEPAVQAETKTEFTPEQRKAALKSSLEAVKETQKLLLSGHFAGSRAGKIMACLGYLRALQTQIEHQIYGEK